MDTKQLLVALELALSKKLTVDSITLLKDDGIIKTIKIVSNDYQDMALSERLGFTLNAIQRENLNIHKVFDITFVLVSKVEDRNSTDYEELNKKSDSFYDKIAAKDL